MDTAQRDDGEHLSDGAAAVDTAGSEPAGDRRAVRWVLAAMLATWTITFVVLGVIRQDRYATFGFDLGIYDQGVWLLSRLKTPFVTVKGLNLFGHHTNPILLLLAPFYRFGAGPKFLLVVQVVAQASGAVAIFLLARDRLADRWLALLLAGVLLVNPTYQFLTWEYFHPDSLAIAPLLFAYWAGRAGRWRWFAVAAVLAVACKEDVAPAMAALGILVAVRGNRRIGLITAGLSAAWFVVATRVVMPAFLGGLNPFYDSYFGDFGSTAGQVVGNIVRHPGKALSVGTQPDRLTYYRMMLAPLAFLPLLALPTLSVAAPMLAVNAFTSFPYAREIKYHYAALVLAGLMLATVEAVVWLGRLPRLRRLVVGLLAGASLASSVAWGPSPLGRQYRIYWPLAADSRLSAKQQAVSMVPGQAAVAATYYFVPHLTHRPRVYEFPEPWKAVNWGIHGERLHNPAGVQWLILDRALLTEEDSTLLNGLLGGGQFQVRSDRAGILVAQRVAR